MMINTSNIVSITEANQDFSRVARMVDENVVCGSIAPCGIICFFTKVIR